ncbi:MAG TPA: tetratricopeptide repeat protein [Chitinophagaceae bacterium]|nr:tetratricopeptide repeat protein [Chitinophagaceae bacterium]
MRHILAFLFVLISSAALSQEVEKLMESARAFTRNEDYANAKLVLNRALQLKPNDPAILKQLAYTNYLAGDLTAARDIIMPVVESENADVQSFQIACNIYKGAGDSKECERLYKKGLKKFPNSGALHFEYGEVLLTQEQPGEAIKQWEEGIEKDPAYPGNYYHAGKYYYYTKSNPVLSIIYGEIFVNSESYTVRTAEIKNVVLESYKMFYADEFEYGGKKSNPFQQAIAEILEKQRDQTSLGINTESLTMIRTRFLLDWYNKYAAKFPYRLFEQQQYLLREGMFEAYNQWLFGAAANVLQYQQWASANSKKNSDFTYYQKNRVFKMPAGQYYK